MVTLQKWHRLPSRLRSAMVVMPDSEVTLASRALRLCTAALAYSMRRGLSFSYAALLRARIKSRFAALNARMRVLCRSGSARYRTVCAAVWQIRQLARRPNVARLSAGELRQWLTLTALGALACAVREVPSRLLHVRLQPVGPCSGGVTSTRRSLIVLTLSAATDSFRRRSLSRGRYAVSPYSPAFTWLIA